MRYFAIFELAKPIRAKGGEKEVDGILTGFYFLSVNTANFPFIPEFPSTGLRINTFTSGDTLFSPLLHPARIRPGDRASP